MTRFLLIRHAITNSVGKRLSGRMAGVPLNEEGKIQASLLAERLSACSIQAVYSSPIERAIETAAPLSSMLGVETKVDRAFQELDFGDWTNKTIEELQSVQHFATFNTFRSVARIPGGEMMLEAQLRMVTGIKNLCSAHENQTIAIVSHADMIKAALTFYMGIHLDMFQRLEISPASVSILELYNETARIVLVNDTGQFKI